MAEHDNSNETGKLSSPRRCAERAKTVDLLDSLTIVEVTRTSAEKAGTYKRTTKSQGLELDDCVIAATAFAKHAMFVTGKHKHYPMTDINKSVVDG